MVPLDRLLHRGERLLALLARGSGVRILVQLDAGPIGQLSQRVHEIKVLDLAHEGDLVTRDVAPEAVVATLFGIHGE